MTGLNFVLGLYEKFQPGFRDEKRPKILGTSSGAKFEKLSKHGETKILPFAPIIASAILKAVSLQLNGMLMMWKIQPATQDDAICTARIHPAFIPLPGLKCSYGKISTLLTAASRLGTEPAHPLICHIENFTKDLEVRQDLGN